MENATKALLIAGGVLIAVVILTVAVYLYTLYSNQSEEYNQIISATELQKFNSKFEVYIGRTDIDPQEIATAIKLSIEYGDSVEIEVYSGFTKQDFISPENFVGDNFNSTYSCTGQEYDATTGKITKLKFTENEE